MTNHKRSPATFPLIFGALLALCVGQAVAYEWFYDPASGGAETGFCRDCHSSFSGRGDLHDMHVGNSQFTSDCQTCHFTSNGDNPRISKTGVAERFGCVGCHGGDYGKVTGTGDPEYQGYGLRRRHVLQNGVAICATCHDLSVEGLPEDVDPPFYGLTESNIPTGGSCNQSPFPEDGDNPSLDTEPETAGIDIDGDGLYDMADPDCDRAVNQGMPPRVVNVRYTDLSSSFNWTVLPVGGYDVIKGNLKVTLGARRFARLNDTWLSSAACASATVTPNQFVDTSIPQRGGGLYYVVRSADTGVGTGDSDGLAQQGARDASLPGSNCP